MFSSRSTRFQRKPAAAFGPALFAISAAVGFSVSAVQAAKRCDWHGPLSGGEFPYAKCVDFAALQGKTLDLPKNVTRISADGLSFCQPATPTTGAGNADIVFIYDNSGSMTADGAYVAPGTTDTSFYYLNGATCNNNPKSGTFSYATKEGPQLVQKLTANANCGENIAGDPYNARGYVIKSGIDFLAASSPTSTGGAISFNSDIEYLQPPVQMNVPANVAQIKSTIKLDKDDKGTIYRKPLQQAKTWLNNKSLIKTGKQAIIFISDGAPKDAEAGLTYLDLVDDDMPPIFSIYMSKAVTADTAKLKELSDKTGGTFTRVNPNDPAAMENLLKSIITTITKNTLPKAATITNKTLSQTSKSTGVKANADGSAGMVLDSIIALKEGVNQIEIRLTREDNTDVTYAFNMNVAGGEISKSSGNYSCWDMPTLTAIDKKTNLAPEIYDPEGNTYPLKLTRSPSDLKDVTVAGSSANKDKEDIKLAKIDLSLGYPIQTGDFTYNPAKPNPAAGNGVLEVDGKGDLTFVWSHPRDARETVTYILPGRVVPVLDGDANLHIKEPVTQGVTFDPGSVKGKDPVVVIDSKDNCIVNCSGTEDFHTGKGVPTWELTVKSPFKYSIRLFDNLGHFVSVSKGELSAGDWAKISKTGDSAAIQMKIVPVSKNGQQLGTGAYVMHAEIMALGDQVTKNSAGESIIVRNGKTEYLKKFGYVRK